MPKLFSRNEAQDILNAVLQAGRDNIDAVDLTLDSVDSIHDQLVAVSPAEDQLGMSQIYRAVLDGALDYQKQHGSLPDAGVVASALDQASLMLDDAVNAIEGQAHSPNAFVPMKPIIAIRSMIATAIPFAVPITADRQSGEGSIIIVSHHAAAKTGMYTEGASLNGVEGGYTFISPERTHKLAKESDNVTYKGKITLIQTKLDECDQSATVCPLYQDSTQIYINGLLATTTAGKGDNETASTIFELGGKNYTINATVNIKTGEVEVKTSEAFPENTDVTVTAYLNVEADEYKTPSVRVHGEQYKFKARNYRSNVVVNPEAARQFADEIGIDPAFEGTFAIRNQLQQEALFSILHNLSKIGSYVNNRQFNFDWSEQGKYKNQRTIAEELMGQIEAASKQMARDNGSHGVSHLYVGERLASIISSFGEEFFEASGLNARGTVYRIGRLKTSNIEVYYTPKGISNQSAPEKSERILLIGANVANPAFNPVVIGEVSAPNVEQISATKDSPNKGYWVTGRRIVAQNPVKRYASSVAVIDCINMAY